MTRASVLAAATCCADDAVRPAGLVRVADGNVVQQIITRARGALIHHNHHASYCSRPSKIYLT